MIFFQPNSTEISSDKKGLHGTSAPQHPLLREPRQLVTKHSYPEFSGIDTVNSREFRP